ncbi:MAG: hypothetical protein ACYTGP_12755 [Planctomycetota bacterium]|jgi:hypothetical protein
MNDLTIFVLGSVITLATVTAVLLVGRSEARDPALNRKPRMNGKPARSETDRVGHAPT